MYPNRQQQLCTLSFAATCACLGHALILPWLHCIGAGRWHGCSEPFKPVRNGSCNDVDAVEEALHRCCSLAGPPAKLSDVPYFQMKDVFEKVLQAPDTNRCLFVFFDGHGIQTSRGGLLVPCDAEKQSAKKLIPVEWIRQSFRNKISNGILVLVLACCRHADDSLEESPLIKIPSARGAPKSICDVILYGCGPCGSTLETTAFARRHDMPRMCHSKLSIRLTTAMWRAHFESLPVYRILELVQYGCEMEFQRWDALPELVPRFQDESLKHRLFLAHPNANPRLSWSGHGLAHS